MCTPNFCNKRVTWYYLWRVQCSWKGHWDLAGYIDFSKEQRTPMPAPRRRVGWLGRWRQNVTTNSRGCVGRYGLGKGLSLATSSSTYIVYINYNYYEHYTYSNKHDIKSKLKNHSDLNDAISQEVDSVTWCTFTEWGERALHFRVGNHKQNKCGESTHQ